MGTSIVVVGYNLVLGSLVIAALWRLRRAGRSIQALLAAGAFAAGAGLFGAILWPINVFGKMQLLAWGIFLHGPLFLVGAGLLYWKVKRLLGAVCLILALGLAAVVADAFLIEPHWLQVGRVTIPAAGLAKPLRVALITDVQTDAPGEYEERVLRAVMAEKPDLILLGGDYLHLHDSAEYARAAKTLNDILRRVDLHAPLGVFAVRGNVDWEGRWPEIFADLPIKVIDDVSATVDLGPLALTGLSLADSFNPAVALARPGKYHIVLGHSPDFALGQVDADLLLAGHTHGGQVQLPFMGPLMTLSHVPRSWATGMNTIAPGKTLIVSRGAGMERANAPRLRFMCRPEVVIIDLVPRGGKQLKWNRGERGTDWWSTANRHPASTPR